MEFATTNPSNPPLPVNHRVISWADAGGNIYDDTLGEVTLDAPQERGQLLIWRGGVVPPYQAVFDNVGIELRTFLYTVGYAPLPTTGAYALLDFMGAGITELGEWIDAILQLWVQCRGDIGQIVPCHGLNYVLAPQVYVTGIGVESTAPQGQGACMDSHRFEYILAPEIFAVRTREGWIYRAPTFDDRGRYEPIDAHPTHGPFATPEEMARHAVDTLNLGPSWAWEPGAGAQMSEELRNSELPRLRRALHDAILRGR